MSKTEEGNFLIANFMGYNYPDNANEVYKASLVDLHNYHEDWNLLMPVVEKISHTVIKGHSPFNSDQFVRVELNVNGYVKIENLRDTPIFANVSVEGSLINATRKAVIQFIQWYSTTFTEKTDNNEK